MASNLDEIIRRYKSGETKKSIAKSFGVNEGVISLRLAKNGFPKAENRSEAMKTRLQRMTQEQRSSLTEPANNSLRGSNQSIEGLLKKALGVERQARITGAHEKTLSDIFIKNKIEFIPQKAIGVYNTDFAIGSVAVEVFGGNFHAYGAHRDRLFKRMNYILNSGWNIYIIWVDTKRSGLIGESVFNDLLTFSQLSCVNPSFRGQYRVVWSDGHFISTGGCDNDDFSSVIPHGSRLNRRGRD